MSIALADATKTAEAGTRPDQLAFKTAADTPSGQVLDVTDEGVVTAIVSVTGVEDEVADIIVPGAYADTLVKRRPKVCWAHSWEQPVGRVLHIEELLPGDRRLPRQTKDGQPWPVEAGALVASMQFNMRSSAGREAFEAVRFYSEHGEADWSIGYQVPPGKATKDKAGVRHIKGLELYELSVVLFGAHTMTGTLSIKTAALGAQRGLRSVEMLTKAGMTPDAVDDGVADRSTDPDPDDLGDEGERGTPDWSDGIMVAVYPDPDAADAVAAHISGPDNTLPRDELHVTLAFLGTVNTTTLAADDIRRLVTDAVEGLPVLTGHIGGIGVFPTDDEDTGAPTWAPVDVPGLSMLREQVAAALGDSVSTDHGFTPHMTLGYGIGLIDPVPETPVTFDHVRVVYGEQEYSITLGDGQPKTAMDDDWKSLPAGEVARLTALFDSPLVEGKAGGADRNQGNAEELRKYWTTGAGGAKIAWNTPGDMTRCMNLLSEHMTRENAAGYCANRHREMTGMWPGDKDNKHLATTYDPDLDIETKNPETPAGKGYPRLPGSYEEARDALEAAVTEALQGDLLDEAKYEWPYISIDASWPDRVIATRHKWGPTDERETFEMTYTSGAHGIELSTPERVELQVVAVYPDGQETDDIPVGDMLPLTETLYTVASAFQAARIQTKAGRVLSGANERRLRDAVQVLLDVLAAAGVRIDPAASDDTGTDADTRREVDPRVDLETTAPSAQTKTLTTGDLAATLAALTDGL